MKKTIIVGMAALLLLFGVVLAGCKHDSDDNGGSNPESIPPLNPPQVGTFAAVPVEDSGLTESIRAMGYGGGIFVAGDRGGTISYSTNDGVTWALVPDQVFGGFIYSFAYGQGTFVVTGSNGSMAYSRGGTAWTDITATTEDLWKQTDRSGEDGWDGGNYSARIVIFANGKFVAGGDNGVILYSANGESWNRTDSYPFGTKTIWALTYGNGKYIAGADGDGGGGFATSADGITWTKVVEENDPVAEIVYATGKFITLTKGGTSPLRSSADGIAWKPIDTSPLDGTFMDGDVERNTTERGGEFVRHMTAGSNSILGISYWQADIVGSVDGTTWVKAGTTTYKSDEILSMVYGNGKFLFATRDAKIYRLVE